MARNSGSSLWAWGAIVLLGLVLAVLPLRAAADIWRAPALWPQELGTRGLAYVTAAGAGVPRAAGNSFAVAAVSTLVAALLGWPAARLIGGGTRIGRVLLVVLALPLVVPPLAVGTGLSTWFLRLGVADSLGTLVLSHLIYVIPYVSLTLAVGFSGDVEDLEEAARALGAGRLTRLVRVTAPAVAPALSAALLLGFVVSWTQYGTSLAIGGGIPMLPLLVVPFAHTDPQIAAALSLVFLLPLLGLLGMTAAAGRQR
jgi:putative spermidine/putrescine transport system permease protein